ncbi:outer membrane beta-barrel protein [Candidatus Woesearchaeota archaeon]|nr:outer membrane beta-barrel protein [Candidatus Woesearchaeota archaeon]
MKKLACGLTALALAFSSTAKAEPSPKASVSLSGSYARELTSDGAYYGYVRELREALNMYKPLNPSGVGFGIRVGAFIGKGYGLECEAAGFYRAGSTGGRIELLNETILTSMNHTEWRVELWVNALREFYPFSDASSVYFGAGLGVLADSAKLGFGIRGVHFPVREEYKFNSFGFAPGARIFLGSSIQLYKGLFLNVRPGLKVSSMMMGVDGGGNKNDLLPDNIRKSNFEFDLNAALELRF